MAESPSEHGATLRASCHVVDVHPDAQRPYVKLASGEVLHADLIVGADGVKSMCRSVVLGAPTTATATGDAVYRAIVPTDAMLKDPELRPLVENPEMTGWMGPKRHIMGYNIVRLPSIAFRTGKREADRMHSYFDPICW